MKRKVEKLSVQIMLLLLSQSFDICFIHIKILTMLISKLTLIPAMMILMKVTMVMMREMLTCSKGRYSSSSTGGNSGPGLQKKKNDTVTLTSIFVLKSMTVQFGPK